MLGGAQTLASNSEVSTKFCEMAALPPLDGAAWEKPKANVSAMSRPLKRDHSFGQSLGVYLLFWSHQIFLFLI